MTTIYFKKLTGRESYPITLSNDNVSFMQVKAQLIREHGLDPHFIFVSTPNCCCYPAESAGAGV